MRTIGILIICFSLLAACGGGGGSGTKNTGGNNLSSASATSSSSATNYSVTAITGQSAARLAGAFLDTLALARQSPQQSPEYESSDGKKTGKCDNDSGSYEITVANGGTKVDEAYKNCVTFVFYTENSGEYLTLSGKQSHTQTKKMI